MLLPGVGSRPGCRRRLLGDPGSPDRRPGQYGARVSAGSGIGSAPSERSEPPLHSVNRRTSSAAWGLEAAAMMARARSMPAVTPADVHTAPSRTTRVPSTRSTSGHARTSSKAEACVATCFPSSSPAACRIRTPVQTDATRSAVSAWRRTNDSTASLDAASRDPWPPGTTSRLSGGASANVRSGRHRSPYRKRTGPSASATVMQGGPSPCSCHTFNISHGPARSRSSSPGARKNPIGRRSESDMGSRRLEGFVAIETGCEGSG